MIAATNKEKGIELDIRAGSFCIYRTDTFKTIYSGTLESFRNNHDDMRKWATAKFDHLCKVKQ